MLLNGKSYDLKCPSNASWKIRAKIKCNSTMKYFCLHNNVEGKYVEGCKKPDWDRKGIVYNLQCRKKDRIGFVKV